MAYRFLHTADIHLDSPLRTLALRNPELSELIGLTTRRSFVRIIDLCLEEQVDALVIAGDLYDGDQTSMKTARFLAEQLRRLHEAGIRTFIIRGNHDAISRITAELVMPDTVKVFGATADVVAIERASGQFPVAIHGLSFAKPHAPESLLRHYALPLRDTVNIGVMHTSLGGSEKHDLYAPCSFSDLQQSGFRYWALGHIHKRSLTEDASCAIVMPGMPQGRDINEDGPKSVSLVTVRDDRSIVVEERPTAIAQFERLDIDVSKAADWKDVIGVASSGLQTLRTSVTAEHVVARVQLTGSTDLAWRLRRDLDLVHTELETRGALVGNVWIDKVQTSCQPPGRSDDRSGAADELARIMEDDVTRSTGFQQELRAIAEELRAQLPAELRDMFGSDETSFDERLASIARDGTAEVMARLRREEVTD